MQIPAKRPDQEMYGEALFRAMNEDNAETFADLTEPEKSLYIGGAAAVIQAYDSALIAEADIMGDAVVGFDTRSQVGNYRTGSTNPADQFAEAQEIEARQAAEQAPAAE